MRSEIAAFLAGGAFLLAAPMALAKTADHQFLGKVSHRDSFAKTLSVKEPGAGGKAAREMTFALAPDAKIMQGSKAKILADVMIGEQVKVTYADEGATHRAKRIDVLSPRTARAAPAKLSGTKTKPKD